jgi:hypothetical protein
VGGLKPPSFASFDKQFNSYDWLVLLDGFMSTLWLVHGQSTIEIHSEFETYSNYHKLCSFSKNEFLIFYKVDLAEPEIQSLSGTPTLRAASDERACKDPL